MKRFSTLTLVVAVWAIGCSSSGSSGGCAALAPLPAQYAGPKTDNAVNIQLSPEGINYINNNWQQLIGLFAPGGMLNVPVSCIVQNVPVIGDVFIADQNLDRRCNASDTPVNVQVVITDFNLTPRQPDLIEGTISVTVDTGKIYADADSRGPCLLLSHPECSLRFDTTRAAPPNNSVTAQIKFAIDQKWDKRMSFTVLTPLKGTQICGASGASPKPFCLDPADIDISGENICGDIWCGLADWDPVKNLVLQLLSPTLQTQIATLVADQACQPCGTNQPACPMFAGAQSVCTNNKCMDTAVSNKCVPRFLGAEGRVNLGATMANFGVPAEAALDLSLHAGASFSIDSVNALNIGTRGGLAAVTVAPCVPPSPAPPMVAVTAPDFRADAPPVTPTNPAYHMALGVSSQFLNLAFHQAQQGGALCLQLSSATVGLLNTGLFKTFLGSLGKLTTRDGKDAPMMVVLRPGAPPEVKVGPGGNKPLITLTMKQLSIDFYASFDDRFARLFTLKLGIALPLSLTFSGCTKVTPAIGDLKSVITKPDGSTCLTPADCIETSNSEILAEDPKVLADIIPAVIGLAEPALASGLAPIDLPDLGAFKLKVNAGKGVGNIAGTETYNHLGLYATMLPINAACATVTPRTSASLKRSVIPRAEQMRLRGQPLPWPIAVLDVKAEGREGTPEFAVRVDDGLWSEFRSATAGGELEVSHPSFLLQGLHKVEVRSRVAEDPHGISEPKPVGFMVDWEPPEVSFAVHRANDRLVLAARDVITPAEKLSYSYRVGDGPWSDFGPPRDIVHSAIEQQGGVTARVRDEAGNVGEVAWRVPTVALRPDDVSPPIEERAGCSTAGVGLSAVALLALALRRRRR